MLGSDDPYLTRKEKEVLELFLAGYGTGTIAERLGCARETARTHLKRIEAKFSVHSHCKLRELFADRNRRG